MSDEDENQPVISGASTYSQIPLSAYREDHRTNRIFIIATLSVIALTVVATFVVVGTNGSNERVISVAREIATAVVAGLVGVLAGTAMKR